MLSFQWSRIVTTTAATAAATITTMPKRKDNKDEKGNLPQRFTLTYKQLFLNILCTDDIHHIQN